MNLDHPALVDLLRKAYSAEKAASFAYIGHAGSLRDQAEKDAVRQIEQDEMHHFHDLKITEHDRVLYEMGMKEKEHEVHFLSVIRGAKWLPLFERVFAWGAHASLNDVDLDRPQPVETSGRYCKRAGTPPVRAGDSHP